MPTRHPNPAHHDALAAGQATPDELWTVRRDDGSTVRLSAGQATTVISTQAGLSQRVVDRPEHLTAQVGEPLDWPLAMAYGPGALVTEITSEPLTTASDDGAESWAFLAEPLVRLSSWRLHTLAGSAYDLAPDEHGDLWLQRRTTSDLAELRRDAEWMRCRTVAPFLVGHPTRFVLDILGNGILTLRNTTPIVRIERLGAPGDLVLDRVQQQLTSGPAGSIALADSAGDARMDGGEL